ncbi:MAG: Gldg family protein [Clostridia bacterium]|nr:Gldg family protein [Clostridia bacterium]
MNTEQKNNKKKSSFSQNRKTIKIGSFSITMTAVVIVICVLVNLFVNELPSTFTKLDYSSRQLYTVGDETETVLAGLDSDIRMYLVAERGTEDSTILTLLERYESMSDHIHVSTVDPATNPAFIGKYTEESVSPNSVIVESDLRYYVVDYYDIYTVEYTEEEYYYYMYYGVQPTGTSYFNGELAFTTAVDYVSRDDLPVLYSLTGHGETALSTAYQGYVTAENIAMAEFSLLTVDAIPADCSAILINNPTSDINSDELAMLQEYLSQGGNIILVTAYNTYSEMLMPNMTVLVNEMGLESVDGIIVEGNRSNYTGYPYTLLPSFGSKTTGPLSLISESTQYVLMEMAHGIIDNGAGSGTVIPMLATSSSAYVKDILSGNATTWEKEEGDVTGMSYVGAAVYGTADGTRGDEYKFVWYSSPAITDENADYYVSGGNSDVFIGSVNWMAENKINLSILAKQLQVEALVLDAGQISLWSAVGIFVLPLSILVIGFVVWIKRRKR